jgi:hypothetical protein
MTVFGLVEEEVIGECRELYNEELYSSWTDQIKENEMNGACNTHWSNNKCAQNLCWKIRRKGKSVNIVLSIAHRYLTPTAVTKRELQ